MNIPIKMRDELLRAVNHKDNKTGFSNIPIAKYKDETGSYVFAVLCQKCKKSD